MRIDEGTGRIWVAAAFCAAAFVFSAGGGVGNRVPKAVDKELDKLNGEVCHARELSREKFQAARDKLRLVKARLQHDTVALTIFPPTPESMPKEPYWRMLVLDEYANGVGSTSASLLAADTGPHRGMHKSHFGGRAPPADEKLNGEWRFHFEPLISKHLPLPGPFESVTLLSRRAYRFNEPALFGHLEEWPAKQVRYRVMFPADTRHIAPAALDEPLQAGTPADLTSYPGTTLALNLTRDERAVLNTTVQQVTGGQTLNVEKFTEAAIKFLHEHHTYTRNARIPKNSREGDPVLRWLRSEMPGHCEYFAYSFQLMARAAGHPTRVIIGLAGAEFSQKERRYVAKLPLHAWNEIFDGTKWVRVEPTPGKGDGKPQELQKPKVEEPERSVDWKPKLKPRNLKLVTEFERAQWPESYRKAIEAYFTTIGNLQR
jgi:transglutaminase-like putative cysteine protease